MSLRPWLHPDAASLRALPPVSGRVRFVPWIICALLAGALQPAAAQTAGNTCLPRVHGDVETRIAAVLEAQGLCAHVRSIAADTNGHLTVAWIVFTLSDPHAGSARSWLMARAVLGEITQIDEVQLTGLHQANTVQDEVIFTAAISRGELLELPAGIPPTAAIARLTRVWTPTPHSGLDNAEAGGRSAAAEGPAPLVIFQGNPRARTVALTFDDGPFPIYTTLLLDTLDRLGLKATFFLVGEQVEQYPYLARAIAQAGHEIGNHTFHHVRLAHAPADQVLSELARAQAVIAAATGQMPRYFRPPNGSSSDTTIRLASRLGLATVFWTANSGDYTLLSEKALLAKMLSRVHAGGIMLFHQGLENTIMTLPPLAHALRQRGYTIGTVTGLITGTNAATRQPATRAR